VKRLGHLGVGGRRTGQPDVLDQSGGEHVWVIVDEAGGPADVVQQHRPGRDATHLDPAGDRVQEAQQQRGERALARAGCAQQEARPLSVRVMNAP